MIDASVEEVLDVLADVEAVPSWSRVYKQAEVIDTRADGRPHHVKVTVSLLGVVDHEVLEVHWGPNWMVWDAESSSKLYTHRAEYTLKAEAGKTRVRFDLTVEPAVPLPPIPGFLVRRARKTALDAATEELRRRVGNFKAANA